ncbi:MAG: RNA-guided endonuclease InsQ/TnpB family protein [bacterium]
MKLAFKFYPTLNRKQKQIIEDLVWHTAKLYNTANYSVLNEGVSSVYTQLEKEFKSNWHNEFLHSHNRQHCMKLLAQDWSSYLAEIKDYKKRPYKYKGQPKPPGFKNTDKRPCEVIFTNLAIRIKGSKLLLSLSKAMLLKYKVDSLKFELPLVVQNYINLEALQQVRIKYNKASNNWYLNIVYKVDEAKAKEDSNIMAIDLGSNNLAALTFKNETANYLISGRPMISKNKCYNREISRLQGIRMKQVGNKMFKNTRAITRLREKRNNYINDYIHKASNMVVKLAMQHNVSTIVIGELKNSKQNNYYRRDYVQAPVQKFRNLISYKAKKEGIKVLIINESYTSGCSAIDLEALDNSTYNKSRRITRGLFKTGDICINADINGSLNIMRKHLKDKSIPQMVRQIRDNGLVDSPTKLRVA